MTLRRTLLLLFWAFSAAWADDRVRVSIKEFDFDQREFNLIVINNNPASLLGRPEPWNETLQGLRLHFYARYIQEQLQAELARNFRDHANPSDTNLETILGWITSFPHPQRHSRYQGSRPDLGEAPSSPLFKIDDLFERETITIIVTSKNDLGEIWAAIRIVASDADRIFWQLRGQPGYDQLQQNVNQYLATSGRRAYQIEHLSMSRGPYDFFNIGIDAIADSGIFSSKTQIYFKTRWRLAPYYLGMDFQPFLDLGSALFFQMPGEQLVENARRFAAGIIPSSILDPEVRSQLHLIHLARIKKRSAAMNNPRIVDFQKAFGATSSLGASQSANSAKTPEFLHLKAPFEGCETSSSPRIAFY